MEYTQEQLLAMAWRAWLAQLNDIFDIQTFGEGDDEVIVIVASNGESATISVNDYSIETQFSDGSVSYDLFPLAINTDINYVPEDFSDENDWLMGLFDHGDGKLWGEYDPEAH